MQCRSASPRIIARLCNASAMRSVALPPPRPAILGFAMQCRGMSMLWLSLPMLFRTVRLRAMPMPDSETLCLCASKPVNAMPVLRSSSPSYAVASQCCPGFAVAFRFLAVPVLCYAPHRQSLAMMCAAHAPRRAANPSPTLPAPRRSLLSPSPPGLFRAMPSPSKASSRYAIASQRHSFLCGAAAVLRFADHRQIHSVLIYACAMIGQSTPCRCSVTPCPASPMLSRPRPPSLPAAPS